MRPKPYRPERSLWGDVICWFLCGVLGLHDRRVHPSDVFTEHRCAACGREAFTGKACLLCCTMEDDEPEVRAVSRCSRCGVTRIV